MKPNRPRVQIRRSTVLLLVCTLMAFARTAAASPQLNPACPPNFFTNVASRLLSSQLNVKLDHIQIYPTNQYTPAVHRLLQVTANILDATTTNYYPSVFRPLFWKTNEECNGAWQTNIYIVGYQYLQEPLTNGSPIFATPTDVSDASVPFGLSGITNNIYGFPWVIGVKKGLPNFNAFELDNSFFIERKLQFTRNNTTPFEARIYTTNQMYVIGISNAFAMDDWNSYAENYTNHVTIVAQDSLSFALTNDAGVSVGNLFVTNTAITISVWPSGAFALPFSTNVTVMQNLSSPFVPPSANGLYVYYYSPGSVDLGVYNFTGPCFIPASLDPSNYLDAGTPPLPQFGLVTTNHLQAYMLDTDSGGNVHILDYVQYGDMDSSLDVNAAIADPDESGLWSTNYFSGTTPVGVVNQFIASLQGGTVPTEDLDGGGEGGQWVTTPVPGAGTDTSPSAQQAYFTAFFSASDIAPYFGEAGGYVTNLALYVQAPFTPMREIVQRFVFQANDPLVHYLTSDLNDFVDDTSNKVNITAVQTNIIRTIGRLSDRYMPWGNTAPDGAPSGNQLTIFYGVPVDENPYNLSYKDPQVWTSDDWNFPTNETLNASWLGQVHRGTPWQTIYLKSPSIVDEITTVSNGQTMATGIATWQDWTGDLNPADAVSMGPTADWQMASLLASLFNTNNEALVFSVNDSNPYDWENLLNGMTVLTNDVPNQIVQQAGPEYATLTISSASSQAAEIASAIESARTALPGQVFATPGSAFAAPQLSVDSPYLDIDTLQVEYGISDAAYEAIPDQLLPLLRVDSIGSMTTANGSVIIQFTGDDNYVYAIQSSPNLVNWTTIGTNCPVNGLITVTNAATAGTQFYRTVLLY
ncbi:MAG TPA: hypothetical protein VMF08_08420 [Candidatus Sulfotelmatobacter sp.]|nr:hypothetical protein [Candidatus Sulfotelmatobacter sp.]